MKSINLIHLIVSLVVAAVLLVVGIYGVVQKGLMVADFDSTETTISEWVMIGLGAVLLVVSIMSYMACRK